MTVVVTIVAVLIMAFTVEALVQYGKMIVQIVGGKLKVNWTQVAAIIVGIVVALMARVDLYALFGLTFIVPWFGMILTGIVFSRGANYTADFIKMIQSISLKKEDALLNAVGDPEVQDKEDGNV